MSYSEIQNKVIDQLDRSANIRCIEDFEAQRDGNGPVETVVEITTYDGDEYYFRYNVWPDGETELHRFKLEKSSLIQYDERFSIFRDVAGDEPFDVAVNKIVIEENKMKEIKEEKKMINFRELYSEAMLDAFKDYVRSNKEDLISYAEDTAKEKIIEHINDNIDLEEVAHNTIDDMIDYYIEYDGEGESEEELEQIICDYILE